MFQNLKIQKTVDYRYLLCNTHLHFKSKKRKKFSSWAINDHKLDNSISRARTSILNIASFNQFAYFFTQTVNSKFDRSDLNSLIRKFSQITRDLRKIFKNEDFFYIVVPELHDDKKNWHLHGLLSSAYGFDSYKNKNGFLSIHHLDKIGWNSISKINNYTACVKYMTTYITKDLAKDRNKGEKLFYCSQKLNRNNIVDDLVFPDIPPIHFDFKNDWCFKTDIDQTKYFNFITHIDSDPNVIYYKNNSKRIHNNSACQNSILGEDN